MATPSFSLHAAIKAKDWGRLENLVKRRVEGGRAIDINEKDANGLTALVMACQTNEFEMASILIENGVDVNIPDKIGYSSLMLACNVGNVELASLLIERGANVNKAQTTNGLTALIYASNAGHVELVRLLIEKGADINLAGTLMAHVFRNKSVLYDGFTALMGSCAYGHVELAHLLIEKGADINLARIDNGYTALMYACHNGHAAVVTLLMENEEGKTALEMAKAQNKPDCVAILETFQGESNEKRKARRLALAAEKEQRNRDRERERERERELSEGETKQSSSSPDASSSQQPSRVEEGGVNQTNDCSNVGPSADHPIPPLPSPSNNSLIDLLTEMREEIRILKQQMVVNQTILRMEERLRSEIQKISVVKDREIADLKRLVKEQEKVIRASRRDGNLAENA